jgi:hypothetical protein
LTGADQVSEKLAVSTKDVAKRTIPAKQAAAPI